jgi:putative SOS response-associated peptidase YedK
VPSTPLPSQGRGRGIFALDETRPLVCFAGIWTNWTSVRKVKEGEMTNDLFAFLTTEPNAEVGAIHPKAMPVIPKAMPVILTTSADTARSAVGDLQSVNEIR